MYIVSLTKSLVNKAATLQQQSSVATFPAVVQQVNQMLLAPTNPWRSTPGWHGSGLARLVSDGAPPPVQAQMGLTDHISQQGQCSQRSRTRQSWWPRAQRPTIETKARCDVGSSESEGWGGGCLAAHKPLSDTEGSSFKYLLK